jgi:hypothetical protein
VSESQIIESHMIATQMIESQMLDTVHASLFSLLAPRFVFRFVFKSGSAFQVPRSGFDQLNGSGQLR